jgi:hypothetical protein
MYFAKFYVVQHFESFSISVFLFVYLYVSFLFKLHAVSIAIPIVLVGLVLVHKLPRMLTLQFKPLYMSIHFTLLRMHIMVGDSDVMYVVYKEKEMCIIVNHVHMIAMWSVL